jgi:hypothetical protein
MKKYRSLESTPMRPLTKGNIYNIRKAKDYNDLYNGGCKYIILYDDANGEWDGINDYWFPDKFKEVTELSKRIKVL